MTIKQTLLNDLNEHIKKEFKFLTLNSTKTHKRAVAYDATSLLNKYIDENDQLQGDARTFFDDLNKLIKKDAKFENYSEKKLIQKLYAIEMLIYTRLLEKPGNEDDLAYILKSINSRSEQMPEGLHQIHNTSANLLLQFAKTNSISYMRLGFDALIKENQHKSSSDPRPYQFLKFYMNELIKNVNRKDQNAKDPVANQERIDCTNDLIHQFNKRFPEAKIESINSVSDNENEYKLERITTPNKSKR